MQEEWEREGEKGMPHLIPPRIKRCILAVKSFMGKKARCDVSTKHYTFFPFAMLKQMFVQGKQKQKQKKKSKYSSWSGSFVTLRHDNFNCSLGNKLLPLKFCNLMEKEAEWKQRRVRCVLLWSFQYGLLSTPTPVISEPCPFSAKCYVRFGINEHRIL